MYTCFKLCLSISPANPRDPPRAFGTGNQHSANGEPTGIDRRVTLVCMLLPMLPRVGRCHLRAAQAPTAMPRSPDAVRQRAARCRARLEAPRGARAPCPCDQGEETWCQGTSRAAGANGLAWGVHAARLAALTRPSGVRGRGFALLQLQQQLGLPCLRQTNCTSVQNAHAQSAGVPARAADQAPRRPPQVVRPAAAAAQQRAQQLRQERARLAAPVKAAAVSAPGVESRRPRLVSGYSVPGARAGCSGARAQPQRRVWASDACLGIVKQRRPPAVRYRPYGGSPAL